MKRIFIAVLLMVVSLFMYAGPVSAQVPEFLGDFCWHYVKTTTGTIGTLRLGVLWMGGGEHYTLSGTLTTGGNVAVPIHGSAELVGSDVLVTLINSVSYSNGAGNEIIDAALNLNLDGFFTGTNSFISTSDSYFPEYFEGTLTFMNCP